jgi:hypothetical protein
MLTSVSATTSSIQVQYCVALCKCGLMYYTTYFSAAARLTAAVVVGLKSPIVSLELAFGIITTKCPVVLLL